MNAQELIARLREWLEATQTMEQKLRCNPDYELPALKDFAALESLLTVKGEPGEAIKILSNYFTPVGNQNRYSVRQYRECITILESTIADLTEKVRVRDEVIDKLIDDNHPCCFCEHEYGDMDCAESNCPEADDIIKAALEAAKEGKDDGSN